MECLGLICIMLDVVVVLLVVAVLVGGISEVVGICGVMLIVLLGSW